MTQSRLKLICHPTLHLVRTARISIIHSLLRVLCARVPCHLVVSHHRRALHVRDARMLTMYPTVTFALCAQRLFDDKLNGRLHPKETAFLPVLLWEELWD